jgi:peptidoglycan/xylan/chitin deacetylase (PgdA/CDA1 family)
MRLAAAVVLAAVLSAGAAAPAGAAVADTPVPILLYPRVAAPPKGTSSALFVKPKLFARQVAALDRAGYTAVTLEQVWSHWEDGNPLPERPVVLSFDDGYADQYRYAAKILRARDWPAILFLQSSRLGVRGGLTTAQVRRMLRDGWELGGHTETHPDLTTLGPTALEAEITASRHALLSRFGSRVDFFAYPFGRFDDAVKVAVADAGYLAATTTRRGAAEPADGAFTLDRLIVNGNFSPARLLRTVGATSGRR